jgi:hypothetical protein
MFRELVFERAEQMLASDLTDAMERAGEGEDPYRLAQALLAHLSK